ncbi:unnamed protein product [Absidia cylindrospora]
MDTRPTSNCLLQPRPETRLFQPRAEDILSDEELLDLFRIIKQIIRKRPDAERIAKVVFCIFYSLGDHIKCYRPAHDDTIIFRDDLNPGGSLSAVRVSHNPSCCDIPQLLLLRNYYSSNLNNFKHNNSNSNQRNRQL